jgi:hypothetical protein
MRFRRPCGTTTEKITSDAVVELNLLGEREMEELGRTAIGGLGDHGVGGLPFAALGGRAPEVAIDSDELLAAPTATDVH